MEIKQYKVENNVAVGVNPYVHEQRGSFTVINADKVNEYASFDESAHTYATNAQDGVYDADCFGEVVWQYEIENEPEFWFSSRDQSHFKKGFHGYNEYMISIGCKATRQFLPLNPIPKMETTELPSPENKYRVGRRSGTVILTVDGQTEIGRIHDPEMALRVCEFLNYQQPDNNDYSVKVIQERIKELEAVKSELMLDVRFKELDEYDFAILNLTKVIEDILSPPTIKPIKL